MGSLCVKTEQQSENIFLHTTEGSASYLENFYFKIDQAEEAKVYKLFQGKAKVSTVLTKAVVVKTTQQTLILTPLLSQPTSEQLNTYWQTLLDSYQDFIDAQICHNDISLSNMGLTKHNKLELFDLGSATPVGAPITSCTYLVSKFASHGKDLLEIYVVFSWLGINEKELQQYILKNFAGHFKKGVQEFSTGYFTFQDGFGKKNPDLKLIMENTLNQLVSNFEQSS